ncbi:hypothetical protein J6590_031242 [Homalodisca vitripennis]|nr:hypothetical protein J6590_031242 [Homalodisca vitripennis]
MVIINYAYGTTWRTCVQVADTIGHLPGLSVIEREVESSGAVYKPRVPCSDTCYVLYGMVIINYAYGTTWRTCVQVADTIGHLPGLSVIEREVESSGAVYKPRVPCSCLVWDDTCYVLYGMVIINYAYGTTWRTCVQVADTIGHLPGLSVIEREVESSGAVYKPRVPCSDTCYVLYGMVADTIGHLPGLSVIEREVESSGAVYKPRVPCSDTCYVLYGMVIINYAYGTTWRTCVQVADTIGHLPGLSVIEREVESSGAVYKPRVPCSDTCYVLYGMVIINYAYGTTWRTCVQVADTIGHLPGLSVIEREVEYSGTVC